MLLSMLINSPHVITIKWSTLIHMVSYIPCLFQNKNGRAFPWTSSLVCPKYLVRIAYLWWWIESLNFIIYLFLIPLSLLHKWLNSFLNNFSDCMGFLRALLVTEITDFWVHFGKKYSKWWGQIWHLEQATIHKLMYKKRGWINVWKATWGTMLVGSKKHG